jgi:hypothetical protein
VKTAADIREDAIALLVEKLREIGAEADQQCKQHREAEKSPGALADFRTFSDHREAAALNYALAYRCEQLAEEITGALLFDELDAQDEAAEEAATEVFVDVADAERYAQRAEYVDYAEAAAVREIEREMAIEAGDDSEIDRQAAEDDARTERNAAARHWASGHDMATCTECADQYAAEQRADAEFQAAKDAEAQDDAWSTAEQFEHDQACEFAQDASDDARNAAEAAESEAGQ